MGTNYYLEVPRCPTCGSGEDLHIGKSSMGWVFALHVYPEEGIHDLSDWVEKWKTGKIENEYGDGVPADEMERIITKRLREKLPKSPHGYHSWHDFHRKNYSMPGPNNLIHFDPERIHNVKPGAETYDLHTGEFS